MKSSMLQFSNPVCMWRMYVPAAPVRRRSVVESQQSAFAIRPSIQAAKISRGISQQRAYFHLVIVDVMKRLYLHDTSVWPKNIDPRESAVSLLARSSELNEFFIDINFVAPTVEQAIAFVEFWSDQTSVPTKRALGASIRIKSVTISR